MRRLKLLIEYDGSGFSGWQVQPGQNTVQETLEQALGEVLGENPRIHGAGRTDAGVHALGQVAHFDTSSPLPVRAVRAETNRRLPETVSLRTVEDIDPGFHSRYDATGKLYRYLARTGPRRSPYWAGRAGWCGPVELDPMRRAAGHLVGTHDFSAFAAAGRPVADPVRTVSFLKLSSADRELLTIDIQADGFLYRMVRNIVGTLFEVGRGSISPERLARILASRERSQAGPTAPPEGLCLLRVFYGSEADQTGKANYGCRGGELSASFPA